MKKILLGTALASLFNFGAAKAQTAPEKTLPPRSLTAVWDPYAPASIGPRFGIEYTDGGKYPHVILGAGMFYQRGAAYLTVSTNAGDKRDKGGVPFMTFRPEAGLVVGKNLKGADILLGSNLILGRPSDMFNATLGLRSVVSGATGLSGGIVIGVRMKLDPIKNHIAKKF